MIKYAPLLLLILTGCSTLQVTTSIAEEEQRDDIISQYQFEDNILYQVSNDQENLHIKFKTSDRSSIMKILGQGTYLYFDIKGKKKRDVSLEYPMASENGTNRRPGMNQNPGERTRLDLAEMLDRIPKEAELLNHKESELIQFSLLESDIKPSLTVTGESEITYDLIIPFHRISKNGLSSITTLSVGIVTKGMNSSSMGGQSGGMGGSRGGSMGGMPQGGGKKGGKGGGMGGGRSGSMDGPQGGSRDGEMASPINIWFLVDLHRE